MASWFYDNKTYQNSSNVCLLSQTDELDAIWMFQNDKLQIELFWYTIPSFTIYTFSRLNQNLQIGVFKPTGYWMIKLDGMAGKQRVTH